MNLIAYLRGVPRCALCAGAGFVGHRTCGGAVARVPCSCLTRAARAGDDDLAPLFTGAATHLPRPWPAHLSQRVDADGADYIHCDRCRTDRYLTAPGRSPSVAPPAREAWAIAMAHRCPTPLTRTREVTA